MACVFVDCALSPADWSLTFCGDCFSFDLLVFFCDVGGLPWPPLIGVLLFILLRFLPQQHQMLFARFHDQQ
jgi:hypothetical protein